MYRFKGVECVRVKDSCLFEHVRIVSYRSPVVPLLSSIIAMCFLAGLIAPSFGWIGTGIDNALGLD